MFTLEVIWEDAYGLAVNKPAGLLTQPAQLANSEITLEALVRSYLRPDDPASVYLGTVHRLDRPVSGVILWAKSPKAAHRWAQQFADRRTHKGYWAITESGPEGGGSIAGAWNDYLTRPDRSGQAQVVPADHAGAVMAVTQVEAGEPKQLIQAGRLSWFRFFPATGRTHQLRAQAASRGVPIVGDRTYGSTVPFSAGIALHARRLTVEHPARRDPLILAARLPACWSDWLTDG